MVMFQSYVSLPEGNHQAPQFERGNLKHRSWNHGCWLLRIDAIDSPLDMWLLVVDGSLSPKRT
jgi:hypothetical protein